MLPTWTYIGLLLFQDNFPATSSLTGSLKNKRLMAPFINEQLPAGESVMTSGSRGQNNEISTSLDRERISRSLLSPLQALRLLLLPCCYASHTERKHTPVLALPNAPYGRSKGAISRGKISRRAL